MNRRDFLGLGFRLGFTALILALLGRLGLAARGRQPRQRNSHACHSAGGCRACPSHDRCRHPNAFSFRQRRPG